MTTPPRANLAAWLVTSVTVAAWSGATGLLLAAGERGEALGGVFYLAVAAPAVLLGLVVLRGDQGRGVGWVLALGGCWLMLSGLSDAYARWGLVHDLRPPGSRAAAVWFTHGWPPLFGYLVVLALIFPDGRLPSRRWRPVAWLGATSFVLKTVVGVLGPQPLDPPFDDVAPVALIGDSVSTTLNNLTLLGMIVTFGFGAAALVVRWRRSHGTERQQLKWVALAGSTIPIAIVAGTVDGLLRDSPGLLTFATTLLTLAAVPTAIGVAVLRYRLYDVDRVIAATALYTLLTVAVAGVFAVVALAGGVWLGRGSPVATAAAAVAATLAARPARTWLQRRMDRAFDHRRYVALARVEAFLEDLRAGRAEPEQVEPVLAEALEDPQLRVYFSFPDQRGHVALSGAVLTDLPSVPVGRTPVLRGEELVATVLHHPPAPERTGVLEQVVLRAGLAIEVARLRVEVRRQVVEVAQSRARIASAGAEERRRLQRDLHDGAQQQLVSIGLQLRSLQHHVGDPTVTEALDDAVGGLAQAIRDLRTLAGGVRPAALDAGLGPALTELAARSAIPTELLVSDDRFPDDVEAAAFFVASEGLANAVKHSHASVVRLEAMRHGSRDGTVLRVVVHDDGDGGATADRGSGILGLMDRVAAVGGRLAVHSERGAGTTLEAVFPCVS